VAHALTWRACRQGDKNAADQAAVDMMRKVLSTVQMSGIVVIGEGEKDVRAQPPSLHNNNSNQPLQSAVQFQSLWPTVMLCLAPLQPVACGL
jgi:hypothetical protein